ncbi:M43 family zinc metalloprotease [Pseudoflavitalea rhizosphaerae]|uniref:M43 family zinc metalloprotease n=1 Tax=Pseudoflavitalea rhizosphaerae TaxID=1884793 RepID=UPI000F8D6D55|nr:M43 family zinc metalloprotease [Pseudoflavitalea rhizosphaerae]
MKHFLFASCCLLLLLPQVRAQRACGAHDLLLEASRVNPSLSNPIVPHQSVMKADSDTPGEVPVIKIPVVVHVLFNNDQQNISEAQIRSQIEVLNKDFRRLNADTSFIPLAFRSLSADCRIEFRLASSDPAGRATKGIVRRATSVRAFSIDPGIMSTASGGSDPWDAASYLNIWVAPLTRGLVGYSSPPGIRKDLDGVVIAFNAFGTTGTAQAPYNKGRTATHEIGHWLGLRHIWGDTDCGDDYIEDTPPQSGSTNGCPSGIVSTCNNGPNGNMYMNFMDFTDDACISMFTAGQSAVMRSLFDEGGNRHSLLQSIGLSAPMYPALPEEQLPVPVSLRLFPNPASGSVQLDTEQQLDGQPVVIRNYAGQLVMQTSVNRGGRIMLNGLKNGMYFLSVGKSKVMKLFVSAGVL